MLPRPGRSSRLGFLAITLAVIVVIIIVVLYYQGGQQATPLGGSSTTRTGRLRRHDERKDRRNLTSARLHHSHQQKKTTNNLDPRQSQPPPTVPLNVAGNTRHACLVHIRQQHQDVLRPLLLGHPTMPNNDLVLVDPAYHSNVGDHMISVAEQVFLHGRSNASFIFECSYYQAGPWAPPCDEVIPAHGASSTTTPVALWHGGGNWGDLWRHMHDIRTASLTPLLQQGYRIVGMPQSLYFQDPSTAHANVVALRQAVATGLGVDGDKVHDDTALRQALGDRLVLTWREHESLEWAQTLYPFLTHVLLPDIAFQLGPYQATASKAGMARVDLVFLLRDDLESLYAAVRHRPGIRTLLAAQAPTRRFTFSIVDWTDRLDRFETTDYYFTETAIQLLDAGRVVICDRLHAAILAYLAGLPFVFVDQVSGKISKTFRVAMESHADCTRPALWERADNLTQAIAKAAVLWKQVTASSTILSTR
jgi:exopolysaccharide biosynthesis predicted pyruvyltransferase EpsI